MILFDIGGGSSELVRLGRSAPARRGPPLPQIHAWVSLPVGVVTLAERHGGVRSTARHLRGDGRRGGGVRRPLRRRARRRRLDRMHMLGTSGTVTTIAGVHLELQALRPPPGRRLLDERRRGHARGRAAAGHELRGARRQSLHRRRARRPGARRLRHPGSDPPRVSRAGGCASPTAGCAKACWCR